MFIRLIAVAATSRIGQAFFIGLYRGFTTEWRNLENTRRRNLAREAVRNSRKDYR